MLQQINRYPYLLLVMFFLMLSACDPSAPGTLTNAPEPTASTTPTDSPPEPDHRVRMLLPEVNAGPAPNPPLLVNNDWIGLFTGDVVSTDAAGEAELQLAGCTGSVYVFMDTAIRASTCRESEASSGLGTCSAAGTGYFNIECSEEFIVDTASAQIQVTGTTYAITHLRNSDLTLVIALDGTVTVRPVLNTETATLGTPTVLEGSEFWYTTPGESSREMGGIPPRSPRPVEEIGPLVNQFGLQAWMARIEARAERDNVLPAAWPLEEGEVVFQDEPTPDFPGDQPLFPPEGSVAISFRNGNLENLRVQQAILFSFDLETARELYFANQELPVYAYLSTGREAAENYRYDPERGLALLAEAGFDGGEIYIIFDAFNPNVAGIADLMTENLIEIDVEVILHPITLDDLERELAAADEMGYQVLLLIQG